MQLIYSKLCGDQLVWKSRLKCGEQWWSFLSVLCRIWHICTDLVDGSSYLCTMRIWYFLICVISNWYYVLSDLHAARGKRFREEVIRTFASIPVPEICIWNCCLSQQGETGWSYDGSASASRSVLCIPRLDYTTAQTTAVWSVFLWLVWPLLNLECWERGSRCWNCLTGLPARWGPWGKSMETVALGKWA